MELREAQKVAGAVDRAVRVFRDLKDAADALVAADEEAARLAKSVAEYKQNIAKLHDEERVARLEANDCKAKVEKVRLVLSNFNQSLAKREKEVEARLEELDQKEVRAGQTHAARRAKVEKDVAETKERLAALREEERRLKEVIRQFQKTVGG